MISSNTNPLPDDWEMKYDFCTRRHFFINHKTKTTTWEDPRKKLQKDNYSNVKNSIGENDYITNDNEMEKIIKMTEKEDETQKEVKKFAEQYPDFDRNYIEELFIKSKGNVSTVEIILRQKKRKETSSIISYSTIDSSMKNSQNKLCQGEHTRFSLSERSKYDAPENSKERIKSSLRSEFATVDNRIVDRVLEATNYNLENSRLILLDTNNPNQQISTNIVEDKKEKQSVPICKNSVSRLSNNTVGVKEFNTKSKKNRVTIAVGPDPRNYSGSQISKPKSEKI